jgi:sugar phosphate isomerase/epimerase
MRFRHRDGTLVHVCYGTNVHPAEDLAGVIGQIAAYGEPVREGLGASCLGLGLWLARDVATQLASDPAAVKGLRGELGQRGLEVVTLNGFPYRGFHDPVVKQAVYHPDWSQPARAQYTADLAGILGELLPDDAAAGSVSTLPLAWREPWPSDRAEAARQQIRWLADELARLQAASGRPVRVAFEPEPGCVVETTSQAADQLAGLDPDRFGLCLDTCHLAVAFEQPAAALDRLARAGLPVVKLQASCALQVDQPGTAAARAALARFDEPRFLHQTREAPATTATDQDGPDPEGTDPDRGDAEAADAERAAPEGTDDLGAALAGGLPGRRTWRVHFHVPLHAAAEPPLGATRDVLTGTLAGLFGGQTAGTSHVEVETYTWQVLPAGQRPDGPPGLVAGIAGELRWLRDQLLTLGLTEGDRK